MNKRSDIDSWWFEEGPEAPSEWNFDSVPDAELLACCYWEYARESWTISLVAGVRWCRKRLRLFEREYKEDPSLKETHDEKERRILHWVQSSGFDYDEFIGKLWETDFPLLGIYHAVLELVQDSALPWQKLPQELRDYLVQSAKDSGGLAPLTAACLGELEELWNANSVRLGEIRVSSRDQNDDSEDFELVSETSPIEPKFLFDGKEPEKVAVALSIDFSRFTNNEILAAFETWVKSNRPERWKCPRRVLPGAGARGKKLLEYRVALDRLGLMRLLHWHSPRDLREENPQAWRKYASKEPDFRRELREATKFFRTLYPFLPEKELPVHGERFGIWMPEMNKIREKVELEMGLIGGKK